MSYDDWPGVTGDTAAGPAPAVGVRYPAPLKAGDVIGVTAPSSGVSDALWPRLEFCVRYLREVGFDVEVGACMDGSGVTSGPAKERAAELTAMLTDPRIRAVVPPWGGDLAIEVLPLLDFGALAHCAPTWLVGYSDLSTLMLPLTLLTHTATLHGPNLMDTPFRLPPGLLHWLYFATAQPGEKLTQRSASHYQERWPDLASAPDIREMQLSMPGRWKRLGGEGDAVSATGRLVGGCLETVAMLPGTAYGDLAAFVRRCAPEGVLVYLEVAESNAVTAARMLHHLRLAGWFDAANAVMIGRSAGPDSSGYTHHDAVRDALGMLPVPVVYDTDFGHVPPQLSLVNGALATLEFDGLTGAITQRLV